MRNWYGPSYLTITTCEIDLRVGGKWRYVLQAPDGSEHAFSGEYLELVPPERLVSTEWYEAIPGAEYVATVTLSEVDGKSTLTNLLRYKSKEQRDGHVASGMEGGMRESYTRLDALLAKLATGGIEIVITRHFDSPADLVFDAWLDPKIAGYWLFATPTGEMKRVEIDARVGGEFVIAEQRGDVLVEHVGRYVEMERPRRLAFTFAADRSAKPALITVEILPADNGCDLRLTQTLAAEWAAFADRSRAGWTMLLTGLNIAITADRQIVLQRTFAAPRELVWQA